ncbi:AbrB/MazE/SpoVT family DNA-binding domain-containing protein [bacterium]|nr:AbrB/MazE/SpoVT family DNA-binding domain-containing protein [bacterium]
MLCKKTVKNQITLPKRIIQGFEDVEYFEAETIEEKIILTPVKVTSVKKNSLTDIRKKISKLGLTEKGIEKAITWARKI